MGACRKEIVHGWEKEDSAQRQAAGPDAGHPISALAKAVSAAAASESAYAEKAGKITAGIRISFK